MLEKSRLQKVKIQRDYKEDYVIPRMNFKEFDPIRCSSQPTSTRKVTEEPEFFTMRAKMKKNRRAAKKLLSKIEKAENIIDVRKTMTRWGHRKSISILPKKQ